MTDWTLQPFIHQAIICVQAPVLVVSPQDAQLRGGAEGYYASDKRLINRLVLTLDGQEPEQVDAQLLPSGEAQFLAVHRSAADPTADPTVTVRRYRRAARDWEEITITNHGRRPVTLPLRMDVGCDQSDISAVKSGRPDAELPAEPRSTGLSWTHPRLGTEVVLNCEPAPDRVGTQQPALGWDLHLAPAESWSVRLRVETAGPAAPAAVAAPAHAAVPWSVPQVQCADPRLSRLLDRSLKDLAGLLLADPEDRKDLFLAAGAPWYLTLFGRDSLWAARMMLPLGTDLAAGTLRALARRQGAVHDPAIEEQPGKILHEVRRESTTLSHGLALPPLYYGTIDATPLFITLLAEAWRWGMPEEQVAALLPTAERSLAWLRDHADPDGDGFLEYIRAREDGLANQGWKDSADAVQSADGRLAESPIALAEVQGYAYEAALAGADLLRAFGRPGADRWTEWADRLARRFRSAFWAEDVTGPYVAIALDRHKQPVDGVTSNAGHLLATGILSPQECTVVAERLARPDMDSGWGLRTMSAHSRGFNPLGYHTGSVWAHDTAITVAGLAATGHHTAAAALLDGLLEAAGGFDYRLPELHSGEQRRPGTRPAAYPASCRPQAWAAAAGVSLLASVLGLRPDVPAGRVGLQPLVTPKAGAVEVSGIRLGADTVTVVVDGEGRGQLRDAPEGLRVDTWPGPDIRPGGTA
ncbi:glycogen debranching N-terminal domain-containing protein [Streptomyces sp.]|uniref:amylo-alpha-1,6-glucosidase n=1 Tax=Streptomyces sp. TaxID=1931 RepID=UPI002D77E5A8|nr:glycogen debranching N-terminal domain-containing protein [Streptomyces sp.]HET6356425.1 glycogen debranching N-terminal domain-containing protein [Streptomyces sp.]